MVRYSIFNDISAIFLFLVIYSSKFLEKVNINNMVGEKSPVPLQASGLIPAFAKPACQRDGASEGK